MKHILSAILVVGTLGASVQARASEEPAANLSTTGRVLGIAKVGTLYTPAVVTGGIVLASLTSSLTGYDPVPTGEITPGSAAMKLLTVAGWTAIAHLSVLSGKWVYNKLGTQQLDTTAKPQDAQLSKKRRVFNFMKSATVYTPLLVTGALIGLRGLASITGNDDLNPFGALSGYLTQDSPGMVAFSIAGLSGMAHFGLLGGEWLYNRFAAPQPAVTK